MNQSKKIWK